MPGNGLQSLLHLTLKSAMSVLMLVSLFHLVQGQLNPAFTQSPLNPNGNSGTNIFYFVSNSDCNGPIRELFASSATIKGNDASSSRQGPTTCTIRLRSTGQFDSTVLDIEVKSMNIQDCTTQVSIYDGDGPEKLLMPYDCRSNQNGNRKLFMTSGNTASFMMSRQNTNSISFDIEIVVSPVRGSITPGLDDNSGINYYFDKFPQTAIVGIIGAFYALILAICTAIIIFCSRSYWGLNKAWETHQLATIKTGTAFDTKSLPSNVWSVEMKGRASQFSSGVTSTNPRRNVAPNEYDDSVVLYNDDVFQKRCLMNDERDTARPTYVSNNASFAKEDPVHFKEKIITPQVNLKNKRSKRPPSYNDIVSDRSSYNSSDQESDVSNSQSSEYKHSPSSEEDISERSRTSKSDSPSDTEEDSEEHRPRRGARDKKHTKVSYKTRQKGSDDGDGSSIPNRPHQQQPLPLPQMQQAPYGAYHPTHFVPMMAGPTQFQPVPMIPTYPAATYQQQQTAQVHPTEPPVYSYLVRRGYMPQEAYSNSTSSTQASCRLSGKQLKEPELRLDSGVEYMRR